MKLAIAVAAIALSACTTVAVRAPICEPPPIPAELKKPCPDAIMPAGPSYGEFYENVIANVTGPWRECVRLHAAHVAIVDYRDSICAKIKADNEAAATKPWWKFW